MSTSETPPPLDTSRPTVGRRLLGIAIDWALSLVISSAFFADAVLVADAGPVERVFLVGAPMATLGIWAVQHLLLVATLGTTIGHRVSGLRVIPERGEGLVGFLGALIRTVLLALVVPALFTDETGRGYHDRASHTQLVRTR